MGIVFTKRQKSIVFKTFLTFFSGCGGNAWLEGNKGSIIVAQNVKTCTWIYPREAAKVNVIKIEKILTDSEYEIHSYDSNDAKWIVYDSPPQFITSTINGSLTIRIDPLSSGLLDMSIKYNRLPVISGEINCEKQFRCDDKITCISPEFVCNGISDCKNGEDELNCNLEQCGGLRYLQATEEQKEILSQNFPNPFFGLYF